MGEEARKSARVQKQIRALRGRGSESFGSALAQLATLHEDEVSNLRGQVRRLQDVVFQLRKRQSERLTMRSDLSPGSGCQSTSRSIEPLSPSVKEVADGAVRLFSDRMDSERSEHEHHNWHRISGPKPVHETVLPVLIADASPRSSIASSPRGSTGVDRMAVSIEESADHLQLASIREATKESDTTNGMTNGIRLVDNAIMPYDMQVPEEEIESESPLWERLVSTLLKHPHRLRGEQRQQTWELLEFWQKRPQVKGALSASAFQSFEKEDLALDNVKNTDKKTGDVLTSPNNPLQSLIISPTGWLHIVWSLLGLFFILIDVMATPLQVFDMGDTSQSLVILSTMTFTYWVCDMPIQFITGYDDAGVTEMRPMKVAKRYATTWWLPDIMIISVDIGLFIFEAYTSQMANSQDGPGDNVMQASSRSLRMARLTRLSRLVRLLRLGRSTAIFQVFNSEYLRLVMSIVHYVLLVLVINHYVACTFYAMALFTEGATDSHGEPIITWIKHYEMENESVASRYVMSLHWSLTQFAPATNDVVPQNLGERVFGCAVVVFALVIFSSFVSSITNAVNQLRRFNMERLNEEARLREFINARRISVHLGLRMKQFVKKHYAERKKRVHEKDIKIIQEMPESMKIKLHEEVYMPFLMKNLVFELVIPVDRLAFVAVCHRAMSETSYKPRQDVFLEEEACHCVRVVVSGELNYHLAAVTTASETQSAASVETEVPITPDVWLSEMALWVKWSHAGELTAITSCELVSVELEHFHHLMGFYGATVYTSLRNLALFVVGHVEAEAEYRTISDLPLPITKQKITELAQRAVKLSEMREQNKQLSDFLAEAATTQGFMRYSQSQKGNAYVESK